MVNIYSPTNDVNNICKKRTKSEDTFSFVFVNVLFYKITASLFNFITQIFINLNMYKGY